MFEWHSFARQQQAMRQHLRQAVKHYDGRKLQGQVFQHWKRWCNLEGRTNVGVLDTMHTQCWHKRAVIVQNRYIITSCNAIPSPF